MRILLDDWHAQVRYRVSNPDGTLVYSTMAAGVAEEIVRRARKRELRKERDGDGFDLRVNGCIWFDSSMFDLEGEHVIPYSIEACHSHGEHREESAAEWDRNHPAAAAEREAKAAKKRGKGGSAK